MPVVNVVLQFNTCFSARTHQICVCNSPVLTVPDCLTVNQDHRILYDAWLNIHGFKELRMKFMEFVIIKLVYACVTSAVVSNMLYNLADFVTFGTGKKKVLKIKAFYPRFLKQ